MHMYINTYIRISTVILILVQRNKNRKNKTKLIIVKLSELRLIDRIIIKVIVYTMNLWRNNKFM